MPKFSIIIPVYNVEKYIKKCLDSVIGQTFKDYEIIVVNDGTKDRSIDLIKNYNIKIINQKNMGLSSARNTGVKNAKGDYLIFLDSDDYWDKDLLKEINKSLDNNPDIVRFQIREVTDEKMKDYNEIGFYNLSGVDAFERIVKYHFVENAWCYAIKKEYYLNEKFKFMEGKIHEDFGLIPLVIIKSKIVNSIEYIGYNYYKRTESIMNSTSYEKIKKRVDDFYQQYKFLVQEIDKTSIDSKYFKSFIANSLVIKICELNSKDYKEYKKILLRDKVYDKILNDTFSRKVKKIIMKISPKLFVRIR